MTLCFGLILPVSLTCSKKMHAVIASIGVAVAVFGYLYIKHEGVSAVDGKKTHQKLAKKTHKILGFWLLAVILFYQIPSGLLKIFQIDLTPRIKKYHNKFGLLFMLLGIMNCLIPMFWIGPWNIWSKSVFVISGLANMVTLVFDQYKRQRYSESSLLLLQLPDEESPDITLFDSISMLLSQEQRRQGQLEDTVIT
jgi:Eukaryotic cytochrome b561